MFHNAFYNVYLSSIKNISPVVQNKSQIKKCIQTNTHFPNWSSKFLFENIKNNSRANLMLVPSLTNHF